MEAKKRQLRADIDFLSQQLERSNRSVESAQALELAELIIDNSTAVLFRRLAADDPKKRKMVYVSPNISRFGYQADDFINNRVMFRDIVYPGDSDRTLREIRSFVERGIDTYTQIYRIVTKSGELRWVEDRTSIYQDAATGQQYHQGIVIDIHEQKVVEERLRKSEEKHRRIVETAGEGFVLMDESFRVIDLNSTFSRLVKQDSSEMMGRIPFDLSVEECRRYMGGSDTGDGLLQNQKFECELTAYDGKSVPVLVHANSLRSDSDEIIGTMAFVTDLTAQKKALQLAAEVQKGLLPAHAPTIPGLDIAGVSVPCDEVGGDYFDYLTGPNGDDDSLSIVVGDISGHGVDSALLMSSVRSFIRMRMSQPGTIEDVVTTVNEHLIGDVGDSGRFMTLLHLAIDRYNNRLEWVRAGHDPGLLYDPVSDRFKELKGPGLALGIDGSYSYSSQHHDDLRPGQVVALITDGIWEECNAHGEPFGKDRLKSIIREYAAESADTILDKIIQQHTRFTEGVRREDDVTLVIVRIV